MTQTNNVSKDILDRACKIQLLAFDVDGVLTDGLLWLSSEGELLKAFNVQDGFGISLLKKQNIETAIITGRSSPAIHRRAQELAIKWVYLGCNDKLQILQELVQKTQLSPEQIAYVGDDWPDIGVLSQVGLAIGVANATQEVKNRCHYITQAVGGQGAIREVSELVLKAHNKYSSALSDYTD